MKCLKIKQFVRLYSEDVITQDQLNGELCVLYEKIRQV